VTIPPAEGGLIGIALPTRSPLWLAHGKSLATSLAELGYETDLKYASDEPSAQASQVKAMIARGATVLVIAPVEGVSLTAVIGEAAAAGIRVVSYDRLVRDTPNVDYYATFDAFGIGVLQGESIVGALHLDDAAGPFNVELFAGPPDGDAGRFFDGAMSVLQPFLDAGRLVVPSGETRYPEQIGTLHWDGGTAQARMDNLLRTWYADRRVDAVLSPRDAMSRGVIASLRQEGYYTAGRWVPVVTGQDAELASVQSILAGEQTSTVFRDSSALAARAAAMVDAMLKGRPVEVNDVRTYDNGVAVIPSFVLSGVTVTRDNAQEVLVDSGYYTAAELAP
jgi:putative multiple sugar transport system substrate-binding protein